MERRVFVAILLSFAVLYGYQALFVPPQKPAIDVVEPKDRMHNQFLHQLPRNAREARRTEPPPIHRSQCEGDRRRDRFVAHCMTIVWSDSAWQLKDVSIQPGAQSISCSYVPGITETFTLVSKMRAYDALKSALISSW